MYSGDEIRAMNAEDKAATFKRAADKLTHENDMLREAILEAAIKAPRAFSAAFLKKIGIEQTKHRKEDLARLEKVFRASKDAEKLGKVMLADPTKPLAKQLGFDPDDY
jgi:pyruvate/oxaloacetate carboxyltransferase